MNGKILLVEDNISYSNLYKERLEMAGFTVKQLWRGEEAEKIAEEYQPDLILLDLMLPGVSGEEVLEKLKSNPKTDSIPVVITTALILEQKREEALRGKVDAYTLKTDFVPKDLVEIIEKIIAKNK